MALAPIVCSLLCVLSCQLASNCAINVKLKVALAHSAKDANAVLRALPRRSTSMQGTIVDAEPHPVGHMLLFALRSL